MTTNDPVSRTLSQMHTRLRADRSGEIATYIPELSLANPDHFGVALTTIDGHTYSAGDSAIEVTIQSVSKPFVYAMALEDHGLEYVLGKIGAEPSGEAFNAISLERGTGRPANPMINAGAILAASLVVADDKAARFQRILATLSAYAGRDLSVDENVFRSESETGDNNRALAYLMKNAGSLEADVSESLETYFRQCSVLVTATDISVMAATLANGGVNPVTGVRVTTEAIAQVVLSVMATCGMYDGSGEWMLKVGLPAKSGVSGTIIALKPGQFGIGLFSPPLDPQGNSVRGVAACTELSSRFGLHLLANPDRPANVLRSRTQSGSRLAVEFQGDINAISAEQIMYALRSLDPSVTAIDLRFDHVGRITELARQLLHASVLDLEKAGIAVTTSLEIQDSSG